MSSPLGNRHSIGVTLLELVLVVGLVLIFGVSLTLFANPAEYKAKARDRKRLADISVLEGAINEYLMDVGEYPGEDDVFYSSTSLPAGQPGPLEHATNGWIGDDLSTYVSKLPVDPLNNASYFYSYMFGATGYELNVQLEYLTEYMEEDGGNVSDVYEIGNNLAIL
jgi:type II secretory pathway pseudopilin PulG